MKGVQECSVYGVEIPGAEGKAGMTSIVSEENSLDLDQFYQ